MKKTAIFLFGILIIAGLVAIGAYVAKKSNTFSSISSSHLLAALCVPALPCGGQITSQPFPCVGAFGVGVWAVVRVAGGIITNYIFLPSPYLHYLPTHIGQYFVGNDLATFCTCIPASHVVPVIAPCGFFYGTSL